MGLNQFADLNFPTRWARFRLLAFGAIRSDGESKQELKGTALALVLGDLHREPASGISMPMMDCNGRPVRGPHGLSKLRATMAKRLH